VLILFVAAFLPSCATVINTDSPEVSVTARDRIGNVVSEAKCDWENGKGQGSFIVPSVIKVRRDFDPIQINCEDKNLGVAIELVNSKPLTHFVAQVSGSGFATIEQFDKVPYIPTTAQSYYREWLAKPKPRAFALHPSGARWYTWAQADAMTDALRKCAESAKAPFALYAVDNVVVWTDEESKRAAIETIGKK
jgi:hypothetical protein